MVGLVDRYWTVGCGATVGVVIFFVSRVSDQNAWAVR